MDEINQLPFSNNSFWLVMGSALVLYGIRFSTHDIDLGCTNSLFNDLINNGYSVALSRSGRERIDYSSTVHIYRNWPVDKIEYINGIPVADLFSIIRDKTSFGRPKDIADVKLIQEYLKGADKV